MSPAQKADSLPAQPQGKPHCIGGGDQNHPQEKEMQKHKMVV